MEQALNKQIFFFFFKFQKMKSEGKIPFAV